MKLSKQGLIAEIDSWVKDRIAHEVRCRSISSHEDITLTEIYRSIAATYQWSPQQEELARITETEVEMSSSRAIAQVAERIYAARQKHGSVAFLSDMYLSSSTIKSLLEQHGMIQAGDMLLVSSEVGKTKHTGTLFTYFMAKSGLSPYEVWHTGDNPYSDVAVPSRLGIQSIQFTEQQPTRYEQAIYANPELSPQSRSQLAGIARTNASVRHGDNRLTPEDNMGNQCQCRRACTGSVCLVGIRRGVTSECK